MSLPNYKVTWGNPVKIGAMESVYMTASGVAKATIVSEPHAVANEIICGELGRAVRLPIPPSFIVFRESVPWHVSMNFNLAAESLPPCDGAAFVEADPNITAGAVLFDVWVLNDDRHAGNAAFDKDTKRGTLFDHSHALRRGTDVPARLTSKQDVLCIENNCLAPQLLTAKYFDVWADRILQVPEFYIREVVQQGRELGINESEATDCTEFLLVRRKRLLDLVRANKLAFPKIAADSW